MIYLRFYKPYGVLSQFTDPDRTGHPTLAHYIQTPGVYPVGRLDHDSEGLLLLTDDGAFQHRWSDPKFDHPKIYWVQVERIPGEEALRQLKEGVVIQGRKTRPAGARLLPAPPSVPPRDPPIRYRANVPDAWLELTLTEGRNRQVRRMTAAVGHPTLRLIRAVIAGVTLEGLQPGQWAPLPGPPLAVSERQPLSPRSARPTRRS